MERGEEKFELVERWRASGKSQIAFSREEGIKIYKLRYWIKKWRESEQGFGFVEITPKSATVKVIYPNGVMVESPIETVSRLIHLY